MIMYLLAKICLYYLFALFLKECDQLKSIDVVPEIDSADSVCCFSLDLDDSADAFLDWSDSV